MRKEILEKILDSNKNLIVSGDMSSGKTSNVLFPLIREIIERNQSLLVLDSKEEYINKYYDVLNKNNYNIVILNLKDLTKSDGWNPLEYPYNLYKNGRIDEAIDYIESQAKKIITKQNVCTDPYWVLSTIDSYIGIVLALFEDGKEDEINLNSVDLIFRNGLGPFDYLKKYFKLKDKKSLSYTYASNVFVTPKEQRDSIISIASNGIRTCIGREMLSILLNRTTFSYEDVLNKPTAIFVMPKEENQNLNNIITLFIDQLFMMLANSNIKNKFNFILDNIDTLTNIQNLDNMMSSGIPKNIKFEIVTRSCEELTKKYGNYITKLSDMISVEKNIKSSIGSDEFTEKIEYGLEPNVSINIEYPLLERKEINVFDIEHFVNFGKSNLEPVNPLFLEKIDLNNDYSMTSDSSSKDLESINQQVNEIINQSILEQNLEKVKNIEIDDKSDFQQFKITEQKNDEL